MFIANVTVTSPPNSNMCGVEIAESVVQCTTGNIDGLALFDTIITASGVYQAAVFEVEESLVAPTTSLQVPVVFSPVVVGPAAGVLSLEYDGTSIESEDGSLSGTGLLEDRWFSVEYIPAEGGDILGPSMQTVREGFLTKVVYAVPRPEYSFLMWSDGVTTPERQDGSAGRFYAIFTCAATNKLILSQYRE